MKLILKILLILLITSIGYSQSREKVHIEQKSSGIIVNITDLYANCSAKYQSSIEIEDNQIFVIFFDISAQKARCNCLIDLIIQANQIPSGEYKLVIKKNEFKKFGYARDTSLILYTQNIKIKANNVRMLSTNIIEQSECKKTTEKSNEKSYLKEIVVSPNPANSTFNLTLELQEDCDATIQLFNMLGKQVFSTSKTGLSKGISNISISVKDLNPGIYIGKITTSYGKSYNFRLTWSK